MLWWVPAALVTLGAMAWVSWAGRARSSEPDRSDAAQARFAAAIGRELPTDAATPARRPRERSTGIAVRRSQRTATGGSGEPEQRRSA